VSRERVLVVDDEYLIRWSLQQNLAKEEYDVLTAESGEEALRLAEEQSPDLVLLDIHLPGIDGIRVLEKLKHDNPELPVIMITAFGMVETAVAAMKLGAFDYIAKPFNLDDVRLTVRKAMENARLKSEVARLRSAQHRGGGFEAIVGRSPRMREVLDLATKVAASSATTVLLQGESGSGKDLLAKSIHLASSRAEKPYMDINCASIPENLLESELFGHERGAFTDARTQKKGLFELADGGTILLDEVGEMRIDLQAKLLRVIEEKRFRRVGGVKDLAMDVRIVAASNRDLEEERRAGRFREDLYYRLKVIPIHIPPLRERREDILPLVEHFLGRYNVEFGKGIRGLAPDAAEAVMAYGWPGNVRELKNVVERGVILESGDQLHLDTLPPEMRGRTHADQPAAAHGEVRHLEDLEQEMLGRAMAKAGGNQTRAAQLLGITRDTLRYKLKKHGL
jgi:DNA-binding NtrC family response regulator